MFVGLMGATILAGCNRKPVLRAGFAEAHGKVTLDGKPLPNAQVILEAEKGTSYGRTNGQGDYIAEFSRSQVGAAKGKARVSISTKVPFPDEDTASLPVNPKTGEREKVEQVPAKYNKASTLTVQITDDGAPYNFDLSSK